LFLMTMPAELEVRPPLIIPMKDFRCLRDIVVGIGAPHAGGSVAAWLAEELDRATLVPPGMVPARVVTMHARVEYRDDVTDQVRCVTLAYPGEEGAYASGISVLTPVGAALVGMSEGRSIRWRTPSGGLRGLTVLRVLFAPHHPTAKYSAAE
jgi:regulator of nucleoside diphosphate kinase